MNEPIIEIKNISKKYNIKHQQGGYVTLRDVIANIAKSPFKFFKHKAKVIIRRESNEEFWALKNISLNIEQGDTIGIIGHNGAGKSTLLKILTGITPPTTGEIIMRGHVASLLEVGTGFHPELTGRENIFLNGAILGMARKEIVAKFDEIVKFSGVEKFLDTPVKRYSSGMYVRLAFSVAAHMEPDILLVDEVLAVGDAEFQKKCLGKMDEVTKKAGRTIIFVSHNMEAIKRICNKCILLGNGEIKMIGETEKVINKYLDSFANIESASKYVHDNKNDSLKNDTVALISAELTNDKNKIKSEFEAEDDIIVTIKYNIIKEISNLSIDVYLYNENNINILHSSFNDANNIKENTLKAGLYTSQCKIPKNMLNKGKYSITIGGRIPNIIQYFAARNALSFQVNSIGIATMLDSPRGGIICPLLEWSTDSK